MTGHDVTMTSAANNIPLTRIYPKFPRPQLGGEGSGSNNGLVQTAAREAVRELAGRTYQARFAGGGYRGKPRDFQYRCHTP